MSNKILSKIDFVLLFCVVVLCSIGIAFIYSSAVDYTGAVKSNEYIKQIIWFVIGLVMMFVFCFVDYRRLKRYSKPIYFAVLVLLVFTRIFGKSAKGAVSWIGIGNLGIQPSEIAKVFFILYLASYLENSKSEKPIIRFIKACLIMAGPAALILIQPDLGTASVYFPIFIFMCYMAGIPNRYLVIMITTLFCSLLWTVLPIWETDIIHKSIPIIHIFTNTKIFVLIIISSFVIAMTGLLGYIFFKKRYFYWIAVIFGTLTVSFIFSIVISKVLKGYQIARLIVFLDPSSDPRGSGYHIIQSKIAIGSGSMWGRGFLNGVQCHADFIPEQSTDFIFSIFSEEMGFAGGIFLFTLFFVVFARILFIMKSTSNDYGVYICAGVLGMFFYHFVVNVGMVIGIMPITGIPLPFLSYGGSALLTNMISVGLLMSVYSRRLDFGIGV